MRPTPRQPRLQKKKNTLDEIRAHMHNSEWLPMALHECADQETATNGARYVQAPTAYTLLKPKRHYSPAPRTPATHLHRSRTPSVSTFQNQISWNKLWKFLEFHQISWNFTKCSNLRYQSYRMLLIPDFVIYIFFFFYSRKVLFISWKNPPNSWKFLNFRRSRNTAHTNAADQKFTSESDKARNPSPGSWNKLWKFLEFHQISWNLTKCSNLRYQSYRMLLIPDFVIYIFCSSILEKCFLYPGKSPKFLKIPEFQEK